MAISSAHGIRLALEIGHVGFAVNADEFAVGVVACYSACYVADGSLAGPAAAVGVVGFGDDFAGTALWECEMLERRWVLRVCLGAHGLES